MRQSAIIYHPDYQKHLTGEDHPERPERVLAITQALRLAGLMTSDNTITPRAATREELLACHTEDYIELVEHETALGRSQLSTGDAAISVGSLNAALLAAGGACSAVDSVLGGEFKSAFAVVRPPGHHATSDRGMGFCIFNNVAVAARYAQRRYGLERIAIVDWDVHHGNGTQAIFEKDASVFYFSTHQWPLYPGTGAPNEKGVGNIVNCPIRAGRGSRSAVVGAFEELLKPAMDEFKPELILISAGFDAHVRDPLGGLDLTDDDFGALTRVVVDIADDHCRGRVVSVLEGGYDLDALGTASVVHVRELGGLA